MHQPAHPPSRRVLLPLVAWMCGLVPCPSSAGNEVIAVGDLLRFASVGDPLVLDWHGDSKEPAPGTFSPDGSKVAVLVVGGDPERQTNNAALLVYATADLMREPKPVTLAEFVSSTPYQPIAFVRWLPDNETLVFAGTRGEETSRVFRVDIRRRALEELTYGSSQIVWYGIAGSRVLTLAEPDRLSPADDARCRREGCRVTASSLYEVGFRAHFNVLLGSTYDVLSGKSQSLISPESQDDSLDSCDAQFIGDISPDGRYAIRQCVVRWDRVPGWWRDYTMHPSLRECVAKQEPRCWRRTVLVDLASGRPMSWTNAPSMPDFWSVPPIWIDNGRRVIIPAVFESLTAVDSVERARRARAYAVEIMDPATLETTRIGRLDPKLAQATSASWDERTQTLTVHGKDREHMALPAVYFQRTGTRWTALKKAPRMPAKRGIGVKLAIEQSLNDPPVLVAIDARTGTKNRVLDPNPWLAMRTLGKVEAIEWQAKNGKVWKGGLYYPPNYQRGKRYPVVLQTHGFDPTRFSLHGAARNFPGQALAAVGIMILQIDENDQNEYSTQQVWANARAGYEGAIDHLDRLGLIDRNRVGTVGWSATGPTTSSMFTHSDYPIATAAFTDTGVWGWWFYMMSGPSSSQEERLGGSPFGENLASWLEQSPSFNFARMRTPLLMWGAEGVAGTWDWYAGLKRLGKPVEFWLLPTGTHDVYQASQRLKTNQLLVDWFRFWLKDEERSEVVPWGSETPAALAEQYDRWRQFRGQQEEVLRQPRPPLLKWTATPLR